MLQSGQRQRAFGVVDAEPADLLGVGGGGGADRRALRDALEDHREAEHREREVEAGDAVGAAGALAVAGDVVLLRGDAERGEVEVLDAGSTSRGVACQSMQL